MDAKTGANTKTGTHHGRRQELGVPDLRRHDRPRRHRHRQALRRDRACSPTTPASPRRRAANRKITYIDGDEGVLLYRGYPIEQLAEHGDFLETCYLLLYGELPTAAQKADFDYRVTHHTMVHEQMSRFFQGFRRDAHPMAVMAGCGRRAVGLLSRLHRHLRSARSAMIASIRMIAKMPTLAAMAYKYSIGQPFVYPKNDLDYADELPAHVLRGAVRGLQAQPGAGARAWTASSSCTPTTSRTPRPRRCGSPARRAPIRSPASPPASPACGARRMAAPTKRR